MSNQPVEQLPFGQQLLFHIYPGLPIILFYLLAAPHLIRHGFPAIAGLLVAEAFILPPVELGHMYRAARTHFGQWNFRRLVPYQARLTWKQFSAWTVAGAAACMVVYLPLYPFGLFIKSEVLFWLPEWFFDPGYGAANQQTIVAVMVFAVVSDGLIGPIVEELYFRGYLLPRMASLKNWAPVVNGTLFAIYHFWQPHNYVGIIWVGIVLSWVVWKTKNVYLGISIHCALNLLGAISALMAAQTGAIVPR